MNTKENQILLGLIPLSKWNEYFNYPTVSALKQIVFKNDKGFCDTVIRYIGKRQYINVDEFKKWADSNKKD